ncbi:MAG: type VI secretion system protein TssA [Gammaproteobacteria bacterium]|nr:type VI secretion system protein TssA [Gammaproteobacteria bacterium]
MSSSALIDINTLMQPISEENAVGEDIRNNPSLSSLYSEIKSARNSARAAERNSMFDGDSTEAIENWNKISTLAPQILTNEAKDLEVACWYTEALLRKAGFQGLRGGLSLIRHLIEQYWHEGLYPQEDEDGIETRVAAISGLNGEGTDGVLLAPIRSTYITDDVQPGPFSLWQYKQAVDIKRISDDKARSEQISKIGFSMDDIDRAVEQSSSTYFGDLRDDVTECLTEYRHINSMLGEYCGSHAVPPTSKITELLEETLGAVNHIAKHKFPVAPVAKDDSSDDEQIPPHESDTVIPAGVPGSREEAFQQLASISDFFRRTEPHSPISYILDRAVTWGGMSLDELISELIPDSSSRTTYSSLTGVRTNDD